MTYEHESPYKGVRSPTKKRTCLKCGKQFESSGPGNRICLPCQRDNVHVMRKDPTRMMDDFKSGYVGES